MSQNFLYAYYMNCVGINQLYVCVYSISSFSNVSRDVSVPLHLQRKVNLIEVLYFLSFIAHHTKFTHPSLNCCGCIMAFHVSMAGGRNEDDDTVPAACRAYRISRISGVMCEFRKLRNLEFDLCYKERHGLTGEVSDSSA
jgi:hypothetical protein